MSDRHDPLSADKLLSPQEAALVLGVGERTLHRYAAKGWISAHKTPGGHRRYVREDVQRLRERGRPGRGTSAMADTG